MRDSQWSPLERGGGFSAVFIFTDYSGPNPCQPGRVIIVQTFGWLWLPAYFFYRMVTGIGTVLATGNTVKY